MRSITSREQIEKKQKRNKAILGIIIIFLMVFSTAGFAIYQTSGTTSTPDSTEPDDGLNFNGQYWVYNVSGQPFYFTNLQSLTEDIPVATTISLQEYSGQALYIDSEDQLVLNEIGVNLGRFSSRIQEACYEECDKDLPRKQCDQNLIVYRESEENKVYQDQKCVFIEGDIKALDAFLYHLLGL